MQSSNLNRPAIERSKVMKISRHFPVALLILFCAACTRAAIVGGTATEISPPANTGNDNQQIDELLGFDELQNVLLTSDLVIDKPAGIIPAGTVVSSHHIIYDPAGNSSIVGDVVLDQAVVGVIFTRSSLNDSDYLGLPGTNYLNPSLRGFESGDTASIVDANRVSFDLNAQSPGDYARIITASEEAFPGPQVIMRSPQAAPGGVHTNESGVGSVRLLFDQPINFDSGDVGVSNEDAQNVTAYATGSGSPFMIITFAEVLLADRYTIAISDSAVSADGGAPIDGDQDGNAGGDYIFTMEHRNRVDPDNDNDIDFDDLALLADQWLWRP